MEYYLHIPLPALLEKQVAVIEKRYQGHSRSRPHLTILSPQTANWLPDEKEERLVISLQKSLATVRQFPVECSGVNYFDHFQTIYIAVKRSMELLTLHQAIVRGTRDFFTPDSGPFAHLPSPHISLASHLNLEGGKVAWKVLRKYPFENSFPCQTVTLLRRHKKDDEWQTVYSFKLGQTRQKRP